MQSFLEEVSVRGPICQVIASPQTALLRWLRHGSPLSRPPLPIGVWGLGPPPPPRRVGKPPHGLGGCIWMHLVNSNSPSPGRPTPGVVKQDKSSRGCVDTTKTRSGPQRIRMSSGKRPIRAAKGKQSDTEALCHPPPPPQAAFEGRGTSVPLSPNESIFLKRPGQAM